MGVFSDALQSGSHSWRAFFNDGNPPLRQKCKKPPSGGFLHFWRREARPLRALRGGFEGLAPTGATLSESSNCCRVAAARRRRRAQRPQKFLQVHFITQLCGRRFPDDRSDAVTADPDAQLPGVKISILNYIIDIKISW